MRVYFKFPWFAPGGDIVKDNREFKGRLFRKSVNKKDLREVPEELRHLLPKTAVIVEDGSTTKVSLQPSKKPRLADYDLDRAAADDEKAVHERVNAKQKVV